MLAQPVTTTGRGLEGQRTAHRAAAPGRHKQDAPPFATRRGLCSASGGAQQPDQAALPQLHRARPQLHFHLILRPGTILMHLSRTGLNLVSGWGNLDCRSTYSRNGRRTRSIRRRTGGAATARTARARATLARRAFGLAKEPRLAARRRQGRPATPTPNPSATAR